MDLSHRHRVRNITVPSLVPLIDEAIAVLRGQQQLDGKKHETTRVVQMPAHLIFRWFWMIFSVNLCWEHAPAKATTSTA